MNVRTDWHRVQRRRLFEAAFEPLLRVFRSGARIGLVALGGGAQLVVTATEMILEGALEGEALLAPGDEAGIGKGSTGVAGGEMVFEPGVALLYVPSFQLHRALTPPTLQLVAIGVAASTPSVVRRLARFQRTYMRLQLLPTLASLYRSRITPVTT